MPWNIRLILVLVALMGVACADGEGSSSSGSEASNGLGDSWSGEASAGRFELEIPADAPKVIFLGDSISAGLHLDEDLAYPAVLQRRLFEAGQAFQLVNAGVSGDTTAGGLSRIDWLLRQDPEVVVVELGGNDGLRGMDLEVIESNLRQILLRIQDAGSKPLLFAMHIPSSYGGDYARKFNELYEDLADELDVAFLPEFLEGVGGVRRLNLPDGIHPNAEGHERLADNIEDKLSDLLD